MVTDRQRELLAAIVALHRAKGFPGTYRELGQRLGLGPSRICQLVDELERLSLVSRVNRAGRTLIVTPAGLRLGTAAAERPPVLGLSGPAEKSSVVAYEATVTRTFSGHGRPRCGARTSARGQFLGA